MTEKKLNEAYYQPDNLWAGNKTIRELHKITSIPKKMLGHNYQNKHFDRFTYHSLRK